MKYTAIVLAILATLFFVSYLGANWLWSHSYPSLLPVKSPATVQPGYGTRNGTMIFRFDNCKAPSYADFSVGADGVAGIACFMPGGDR